MQVSIVFTEVSTIGHSRSECNDLRLYGSYSGLLRNRTCRDIACNLFSLFVSKELGDSVWLESDEEF